MERSLGIRIGAGIRLAAAPHLEVRGAVDWTKIARSEEAPVTRHGQFMGTIAQPTLKKQAITVTVSSIFG